jgi:dTDP-4-dehydrorhamnose 3,5-epimerase
MPEGVALAMLRAAGSRAVAALVSAQQDRVRGASWLGVELTAHNQRLAYVPEGFAQGYQTLEDDTEVLYQMSHEYVPEAARGVRFDDPAFGIDWPTAEERLISERDRAWPDHAPERAQPSSPASSSRSAARRTTG